MTDKGGWSLTQNRMQFARESILDVLRGLGLPASLDSTHIVVRGPDVGMMAAFFVQATNHTIAYSMAPDGVVPDEWVEMVKSIDSSMMIGVRHLMSPGIGVNRGSVVVDGAAVEIRFIENRAVDGPLGYIIPVERTGMYSSVEWYDQVALIPHDMLNRWNASVAKVRAAMSLGERSPEVMMVFNGPSVKIAKAAINDVVMEDHVRSAFVDDIGAFLSRRSWYAERRLPWTRRYVLNGPPGTGKTTLARWAASSLGLGSLSFDFNDEYASGRDFVSCMSYASSRAPTLLVLDDFEKVLSGDNQSRVSPRTILTALSGMASMDGVIVVATSNSMEPFHGPMRRRFDVVVEVPLPSPAVRMAYLRMCIGSDMDSWPAKDLNTRVASITEKMSVDDLRACLTAAAGITFSNGRDSISMDDFRTAAYQITAYRHAKES